jgi:hypothetical protein
VHQPQRLTGSENEVWKINIQQMKEKCLKFSFWSNRCTEQAGKNKLADTAKHALQCKVKIKLS